MLLRARSTPAQRRRAWEAHERWRLTHERRLARQLTLDIRAAIEQAAGAVEAGGDPARALATLQRVATEHLRDRLRETWTGAAAQMRDALGKGARVVLERKRVTVAPDDAALAAIDRLAEKRAGPLAQSVGARITRAVQDAYAAGEGQRGGAARILDLLADGFPARRAAVIARTETHSAAQAASQAVASDIAAESGVQLRKVWVAAQAKRTRESHAATDGQAVLPDGSFSVGAATLRFPGDPEGPPGEIINCRCVQVFEPVPPGERQLAASRAEEPPPDRFDERTVETAARGLPASEDDSPLRPIEDRLLRLSPEVEHGAAVLGSARIIEYSGTADRIKIPREDALAMRRDGLAILTHTHPRDFPSGWAVGLSVDDLAAAIDWNLAAIRVVMPNGARVEALRLGKEWPVSVAQLLSLHAAAINDAISRLDADRRLSRAERAAMIDHLAARSLAPKAGFRYRVFMPPQRKSQAESVPSGDPMMVSRGMMAYFDSLCQQGKEPPQPWAGRQLAVRPPILQLVDEHGRELPHL